MCVCDGEENMFCKTFNSIQRILFFPFSTSIFSIARTLNFYLLLAKMCALDEFKQMNRFYTNCF